MAPVCITTRDDHFVEKDTGRRFIPLGFNYDHDEHFRLIEDYWLTEWTKVQQDLHNMQALGANTIRIHLQTSRMLRSPHAPDHQHLDRLGKLIDTANAMGLYLNITGLGAYNKAQQPPWFFEQQEAERWQTQQCFWQEVARITRGNNNVFCINLINEPIIAGGSRAAGAWLGKSFADGRHYTQFLTLQRDGRDRPALARQWLSLMRDAVRQHDPEHLLTVGMMDWSLERPPALYTGFTPDKIIDLLDFISVHLYPAEGQLAEEVNTLRAFCLGKPVVIEEISHIHCPQEELGEFLLHVRRDIAGLFSFYSDTHDAPQAADHHSYNANMQATLHFFSTYARHLFS